MQHKNGGQKDRAGSLLCNFVPQLAMKTKPNKVVRCVTRKRRWLTLLRDPFSFRLSFCDRQSSRLMIVRSLCFFDKREKKKKELNSRVMLASRSNESTETSSVVSIKSLTPKLSKKKITKNRIIESPTNFFSKIRNNFQYLNIG